MTKSYIDIGHGDRNAVLWLHEDNLGSRSDESVAGTLGPKDIGNFSAGSGTVQWIVDSGMAAR